MNNSKMTICGKENGDVIFKNENIILKAKPKTDWFHHPAGIVKNNNVISATTEITQKIFSISACLNVNFDAVYDAGAIFIEIDSKNWAKLAYEYSSEKKPKIVSVITQKISDDADGPIFLAEKAWLRIYCDGETIAFHFSDDGEYWKFLRWFSLPNINIRPIKIGIAAQSPTGKGCTAHFNNIKINYNTIDNLRDGS